MAVLADGQKFGLSSKSQTNRSVIYVKLTDSALKSIEDYLKNKAVVDSRQGPSLQFTENGGIICLPQGDRGNHEYSFGLSNEEGGPHKQGRTDYLMSAKSDSGPTLTSLGSMAEILRVKATNDSFRRIGEKFTNVKLENERNSTVLLDNKDKKRASIPKTQVSRKVVSSGVVNNVPSSSRPTSSSPGQSYSGPGRGSLQGGLQGSLPSSRPGSPMSRPTTAHSPVFSQNVSSHPPQPAQPRNSYQQTHKPAPSRPSVNTEIMKRPLRERLIQLLAVRTYKKPEIIAKMYKDGMKDKEKKLIMLILREVSDSRNNVYELRRSMWNEVAEDWPFYSEQDKAALRRRKPQNLTPPGSDTGSTSSGHSPSSTNPPSPPQITNPMRKRDNTYYDSQQEIGPISKRKRTSNFKRTSNGASWDQNMSGVSLSPSLDMEYDKVEDDSAPDWNRWGQNEHHQPPPPPPEPTHAHAPAPPQSVSPVNVNVQSNSQMQPAPNKNMDFLSTYTNITSQEQRTKYKAEFNQYYAKYMKLHNVLDQVSKRFALLEGKLKHAQKGSEEFKNVKARILQEYERNKQDRMYQDARNNFQYLHEKLAHIKKLVHDYDTARVAVR